MLNDSRLPLPAAVVDMIRTLLDDNTPSWQKENLSATLTEIEKACFEANRRHDLMVAKKLNQSRGAKQPKRSTVDFK